MLEEYRQALTKLIGRLRELLGPFGARVVTVRGRGVRLDATVRRLDTPPAPDTSPDLPSATPARAPEPARVLPPHERPIVLIVDDSPDSVLLLTGYRADPEFLRGAGVEVDPHTLVPRHDAETFETNVPNLFIAGGQLAGVRTGTVFIENGRFHGERFAQVLASRRRG